MSPVNSNSEMAGKKEGDSIEWKTFIDPDILFKTNDIVKVPVTDHPLKNVVVSERISRRILGSQPSTGRTTPVPSSPAAILDPLTLAMKKFDPLTEFAIRDELDPLSKLAAEEDERDALPANKEKSVSTGMELWSVRKSAILSKFTTSEKISIITSFLGEGEKVTVRAQSTAVDKVQHRLEQLDYFEEGSQRRFELSQAEYVNQIDKLNKELVSAWHSEQRVKSLKIAIQCAKLLADTDVLSFYPSKFVLVTDILDTFGQLVYDRLRTKADYCKPGSQVPTALPEDFTPDMVPEAAKETCLNWFYKIASIRELVPRIFVEMALIKSYNFLSLNDCPEALKRITDMIHGIGNPLVAIYARCYLCRVGLNVSNVNKIPNNFFEANFNGFLDSYHHIFSNTIKHLMVIQKMSPSNYLILYTPALDFILEGVAYNNGNLDDLLQRCKKYENNSLILNAIMSAFKPVLIAERALAILEMIDNSSNNEGIPVFILLRTLGLCVSVCPPPIENRKQVLGTVWKHLAAVYNPGDYITCVEAWIQFVVQYFSNREINTVLGDIITHMTPNRAYENYYNELKLIVNKIVTYTQDFEMLLVMDNFLPLLDLFQNESIRVEVCKNILTLSNSDQKTNDPMITNSLMFLGGVLHDSVNALTPEDEHKQIGDILCNIVRKVDYGRDFEQQMTFYVEARGAFSNIDVVLAQLVKCVNSLAVKTKQIMRGVHTRKTSDFVRACAAYCYITIPSIISTRKRLELYLFSGQVALFNQGLGQADDCFKAALTVINELDSANANNEVFLLEYIKQFLSTLLILPDNPEKGVLSMTKMLLNACRNFNWNKLNGNLAVIYIHVIDILCVLAQEEYPYHVEGVESNDSLYGSDIQFIQEINNLVSIIIGEILIILKDLGNCRRQCQLSLDLFCRIVTRANLNKNLMTLAFNLWQLSLKNGHLDKKYLIRTRNYYKQRAIRKNNIPLLKLLERLAIPDLQ